MGRRNNTRSFKYDTGQRPKKNRSKQKSFKSPKQFEKESAANKKQPAILSFVYRNNKEPKQRPTDIAIEMFGSTYVDYDIYIKG